MKYIEKLKQRGINAGQFAKTLGKSRPWGYKIYSGEFALRSEYYEALRSNYKFIKPADFF